MELLLLPSRGAATRPLHQPSRRRVAGVFTARPAAAASSSNVEVIDTTAAAAAEQGTSPRTAKNGARRRARLGLNLSEDMRRGMMWRMLAPPAAAVAAEAAFLRVLDGAARPGRRRGLRRAVRRGAARFPLRVPVVEVERRGEGLAGGVGARR